MNSLFRGSTAALCLAFAALTPLAAQLPARTAHRRPVPQAQERTIPGAQVPAAVRDAFKSAYPHATVVRYSTEQQNGRTVYVVLSRAGNVRRSVDVDADGAILGSETQLAAAQLPTAVRTAAEANGARIQSATLVVAGHDTTYAITLRGRGGELKFTADGRPVPPTRQ